MSPTRSQNGTKSDLEDLGNKTGALHVGQAPATGSEHRKRRGGSPTCSANSGQADLQKLLLNDPKASQNRTRKIMSKLGQTEEAETFDFAAICYTLARSDRHENDAKMTPNGSPNEPRKHKKRTAFRTTSDSTFRTAKKVGGPRHSTS